MSFEPIQYMITLVQICGNDEIAFKSTNSLHTDTAV